MAFIIAHLAFDICLGLFPLSVLGEKKPVFVNISHALDELRRFRFGYKLHTSLVFTSMKNTLFYFEQNSWCPCITFMIYIIRRNGYIGTNRLV